jgi:hypothetical protein
MSIKPADQEPATPAMMESEALRAAEAQAVAERRAERRATRATGLQVVGSFTVAILLGGLGIRYLSPTPASPSTERYRPALAARTGELAFLATADDGHSAVWRYKSPVRDAAKLMLGKAGRRDVKTLSAAADISGFTGPAPAELAFTQTGNDVHVVVDGVTRTLRFQTFDEPCLADAAEQTRNWKLCETNVGEGAPACVTAPELTLYCLSAEPRLVSLHRSGDVLWVIQTLGFPPRV